MRSRILGLPLRRRHAARNRAKPSGNCSWPAISRRTSPTPSARTTGELGQRAGLERLSVAVRSSATAEDLPDASFAGQQETFLNVAGDRELMDACRRCYASLFTDRAISYREVKGFDHLDVALSIGVQRMVRSDVGASGVMFSIDTDSGFPRAAVISAAWGLGETVVQGTINPDKYLVFKPLLGDAAAAEGPGRESARSSKRPSAPRRRRWSTAAAATPAPGRWTPPTPNAAPSSWPTPRS